MRSAKFLVIFASMALGCTGVNTLRPAQGFVHTLGGEHPLTGRVWSNARGGLTDARELVSTVRASRVLLLGETHDNADHHALQAELLDAWLSTHPTASVGFEMIDETQAPGLTEPLPQDADALAQALRWSDTGWPEFALYRPVFTAALARKAHLFAAHPSAERVRASMQGVDDALAQALKLVEPLPQRAHKALAQEIRDSHCGHAPEAMVQPMVRAQTFKDAWMARAMVQAGAPVALIAGRGHIREDRGVPMYLARNGESDVLTVALLDVDDARDKPEQYELLPYDFVVFTPRTSNLSACDRFQEELSRMREQGGSQDTR